MLAYILLISGVLINLIIVFFEPMATHSLIIMLAVIAIQVAIGSYFLSVRPADSAGNRIVFKHSIKVVSLSIVLVAVIGFFLMNFGSLIKIL